jgi:hypothetical protein
VVCRRTFESESTHTSVNQQRVRIVASITPAPRYLLATNDISPPSPTVVRHEMYSSVALRGRSAAILARSFSTRTPTPFYTPTLTEKRAGEAGRGGRMSEAACKVAVFGASGFLGNFVCAELGTLLLLLFRTHRWNCCDAISYSLKRSLLLLFPL